MSKYTVLISFTDNETLKGYNAGNTFESENLERVSLLAKKGYIHVPDKIIQQEDDPTVKDLKERAKELGLEGYSKLNKDELIELIESVQVGDKDAGEN